MPIDKSSLTDFLHEVDKELGRKITLIAAGGTAMTLLGVKPSTIDIDFTAPASDLKEFNSALKKLPHGFKIDSWPDGQVFSQFLPADYLEKSVPIKVKFANIELRALSPVDTVATKIGRLNARDLEDIENCIKKFNLTKSAVRKRALRVQVAGSERVFRANLKQALAKFFG